MTLFEAQILFAVWLFIAMWGVEHGYPKWIPLPMASLYSGVSLMLLARLFLKGF